MYNARMERVNALMDKPAVNLQQENMAAVLSLRLCAVVTGSTVVQKVIRAAHLQELVQKVIKS